MSKYPNPDTIVTEADAWWESISSRLNPIAPKALSEAEQAEMAKKFEETVSSGAMKGLYFRATIAMKNSRGEICFKEMLFDEPILFNVVQSSLPNGMKAIQLVVLKRKDYGYEP